jgi:acylphosphatase
MGIKGIWSDRIRNYVAPVQPLLGCQAWPNVDAQVMNDETVAVRWFISGRVQGVGFRWFVSRRASELGIGGWAKNLRDGRVEVFGEGSGEDLDSLDCALRVGPKFAMVENVEKCDCPHEVEGFKSFDVR